jgi:hypothetical protein
VHQEVVARGTYTNTSMSRYIPPLFRSASKRMTCAFAISTRRDRNAGATHITLVRKMLQLLAHDMRQHMLMPYHRQVLRQLVPPRPGRYIMIVTSPQRTQSAVQSLRAKRNVDSQVHLFRLDIHQRTPYRQIRIIRKLVPLAIGPSGIFQPIHVVHHVWHDLSRSLWCQWGGV